MKLVKQIYPLKEVKADLGVEVELESLGENPFPEIPKSVWAWDRDGSLRGNNNVEYISSPMKWDEVEPEIIKMIECIDKHDVSIDYSYRAGVHVHMNCQDLTMKEVLKIACLYYVFEENLINFCGEDRVGNYNCLRGVDAEHVTELLKTVMQEESYLNLQTDDIRYAALNFNSLPKYGTIEFRSMASEPDLMTIVQWTKILKRIKDVALQYDDAKDIMPHFSSMCPEDWGKFVLGDLYETVNPDPMLYFDGLWLAQDLANYDLYRPKPVVQHQHVIIDEVEDVEELPQPLPVDPRPHFEDNAMLEGGVFNNNLIAGGNRAERDLDAEIRRRMM